MSFLGWMALGGLVLLLMALSSAYLRNLPISTSAIYLALGVAIGPLGFGWLRIDLREAGPWFERLTEVAVIVALFVGGLKLRLPLRHPAWAGAYRLAGPVMLASILGVALGAHLLLGLDPAMALLAGAVLAPTDPVLASMVKVDSATDHDQVRYGLSGEAGLNDGAAFPFVVLALLWVEHGSPGGWIGEWLLETRSVGGARRSVPGLRARPRGGATRHLAPQPAAGHRRAERLPGARPHRALLCRRRNHRRVGIPGDLRRRNLASYFGDKLPVAEPSRPPGSTSMCGTAGRVGSRGPPVRTNAIQRELTILKGALNWARGVYDGREPLLRQHPLEGFRIPSERDPKRPIVSDTTVGTLLAVADEVHPSLRRSSCWLANRPAAQCRSWTALG